MLTVDNEPIAPLTKVIQRPDYAAVCTRRGGSYDSMLCVAYVTYIFLLFEHILKLKLVDPKITQQLPVTCVGDFAKRDARWITQLVKATNIVT